MKKPSRIFPRHASGVSIKFGNYAIVDMTGVLYARARTRVHVYVEGRNKYREDRRRDVHSEGYG